MNVNVKVKVVGGSVLSESRWAGQVTAAQSAGWGSLTDRGKALGATPTIP